MAYQQGPAPSAPYEPVSYQKGFPVNELVIEANNCDGCCCCPCAPCLSRFCLGGPRWDEDEYPEQLEGKVTREEYSRIVHAANSIVEQTYPLGICYKAGCAIIGGFLGCLCIAFYFHRAKKSKARIGSMLEHENENVFNDRGAHWEVRPKMCGNAHLVVFF